MSGARGLGDGVTELKTTPELSAKARRFQTVLDEYAPGSRVLEFREPSRTAQQAADAIGCELDQIVKSLVFRTDDGRAVLVLTAGGNRVDERAVGAQLGASIHMADAEFVRSHAGYAIGGVPPFGHPESIDTLIDEQLFAFDEIWAAGGTPNAVFAVDPERLLDITGGRKTRVA
ncbi:MAG: Cys-tRNA(Pro)/Cys-tRNA(Cys) deacylase YbaK [Gammaproteobacteria bacterium]|nr:Cys-tRNA(Pro)/Cys-tRNA(Cys) deacylase YbaK [Gammaproteobacteria bacterium]